eukprot:g86.t1
MARGDTARKTSGKKAKPEATGGPQEPHPANDSRYLRCFGCDQWVRFPLDYRTFVDSCDQHEEKQLANYCSVCNKAVDASAFSKTEAAKAKAERRCKSCVDNADFVKMLPAEVNRFAKAREVSLEFFWNRTDFYETTWTDATQSRAGAFAEFEKVVGEALQSADVEVEEKALADCVQAVCQFELVIAGGLVRKDWNTTTWPTGMEADKQKTSEKMRDWVSAAKAKTKWLIRTKLVAAALAGSAAGKEYCAIGAVEGGGDQDSDTWRKENGRWVQVKDDEQTCSLAQWQEPVATLEKAWREQLIEKSQDREYFDPADGCSYTWFVEILYQLGCKCLGLKKLANARGRFREQLEKDDSLWWGQVSDAVWYIVEDLKLAEPCAKYLRKSLKKVADRTSELWTVVDDAEAEAAAAAVKTTGGQTAKTLHTLKKTSRGKMSKATLSAEQIAALQTQALIDELLLKPFRFKDGAVWRDKKLQSPECGEEHAFGCMTPANGDLALGTMETQNIKEYDPAKDEETVHTCTVIDQGRLVVAGAANGDEGNHGGQTVCEFDDGAGHQQSETPAQWEWINRRPEDDHFAENANSQQGAGTDEEDPDAAEQSQAVTRIVADPRFQEVLKSRLYPWSDEAADDILEDYKTQAENMAELWSPGACSSDARAQELIRSGDFTAEEANEFRSATPADDGSHMQELWKLMQAKNFAPAEALKSRRPNALGDKKESFLYFGANARDPYKSKLTPAAEVLPNFYAMVVFMLRKEYQRASALDPSLPGRARFEFTDFTCLWDCETRPHSDGANAGSSFIIGAGAYHEGCYCRYNADKTREMRSALAHDRGVTVESLEKKFNLRSEIVKTEKGKGISWHGEGGVKHHVAEGDRIWADPVNIKNQLRCESGLEPHWTGKWSNGTRFVIVAYKNRVLRVPKKSDWYVKMQQRAEVPLPEWCLKEGDGRAAEPEPEAEKTVSTCSTINKRLNECLGEGGGQEQVVGGKKKRKVGAEAGGAGIGGGSDDDESRQMIMIFESRARAFFFIGCGSVYKVRGSINNGSDRKLLVSGSERTEMHSQPLFQIALCTTRLSPDRKLPLPLLDGEVRDLDFATALLVQDLCQYVDKNRLISADTKSRYLLPFVPFKSFLATNGDCVATNWDSEAERKRKREVWSNRFGATRILDTHGNDEELTRIRKVLADNKSESEKWAATAAAVGERERREAEENPKGVLPSRRSDEEAAATRDSRAYRILKQIEELGLVPWKVLVAGNLGEHRLARLMREDYKGRTMVVCPHLNAVRSTFASLAGQSGASRERGNGLGSSALADVAGADGVALSLMSVNEAELEDCGGALGVEEAGGGDAEPGHKVASEIGSASAVAVPSPTGQRVKTLHVPSRVCIVADWLEYRGLAAPRDAEGRGNKRKNRPKRLEHFGFFWPHHDFKDRAWYVLNSANRKSLLEDLDMTDSAFLDLPLGKGLSRIQLATSGTIATVNVLGRNIHIVDDLRGALHDGTGNALDDGNGYVNAACGEALQSFLEEKFRDSSVLHDFQGKQQLYQIRIGQAKLTICIEERNKARRALLDETFWKKQKGDDDGDWGRDWNEQSGPDDCDAVQAGYDGAKAHAGEDGPAPRSQHRENSASAAGDPTASGDKLPTNDSDTKDGSEANTDKNSPAGDHMEDEEEETELKIYIPRSCVKWDWEPEPEREYPIELVNSKLWDERPTKPAFTNTQMLALLEHGCCFADYNLGWQEGDYWNWMGDEERRDKFFHLMQALMTSHVLRTAATVCDNADGDDKRIAVAKAGQSFAWYDVDEHEDIDGEYLQCDACDRWVMVERSAFILYEHSGLDKSEPFQCCFLRERDENLAKADANIANPADANIAKLMRACALGSEIKRDNERGDKKGTGNGKIRRSIEEQRARDVFKKDTQLSELNDELEGVVWRLTEDKTAQLEKKRIRKKEEKEVAGELTKENLEQGLKAFDTGCDAAEGDSLDVLKEMPTASLRQGQGSCGDDDSGALERPAVQELFGTNEPWRYLAIYSKFAGIFEENANSCRFRLPDSYRLPIVPDRTGTLKAGTAVVCVMRGGNRKYLRGPALASRTPCLEASDIQKFELLDDEATIREVSRFRHCNMMILPAHADMKYAAAEPLSGGDYDGDEVFLTLWRPLVDLFAPTPPDHKSATELLEEVEAEAQAKKTKTQASEKMGEAEEEAGAEVKSGFGAADTAGSGGSTARAVVGLQRPCKRLRDVVTEDFSDADFERLREVCGDFLGMSGYKGSYTNEWYRIAAHRGLLHPHTKIVAKLGHEAMDLVKNNRPGAELEGVMREAETALFGGEKKSRTLPFLPYRHQGRAGTQHLAKITPLHHHARLKDKGKNGGGRGAKAVEDEETEVGAAEANAALRAASSSTGVAGRRLKPKLAMKRKTKNAANALQLNDDMDDVFDAELLGNDGMESRSDDDVRDGALSFDEEEPAKRPKIQFVPNKIPTKIPKPKAAMSKRGRPRRIADKSVPDSAAEAIAVDGCGLDAEEHADEILPTEKAAATASKPTNAAAATPCQAQRGLRYFMAKAKGAPALRICHYFHAEMTVLADFARKGHLFRLGDRPDALLQESGSIQKSIHQVAEVNWLSVLTKPKLKLTGLNTLDRDLVEKPHTVLRQLAKIELSKLWKSEPQQGKTKKGTEEGESTDEKSADDAFDRKFVKDYWEPCLKRARRLATKRIVAYWKQKDEYRHTGVNWMIIKEKGYADLQFKDPADELEAAARWSPEVCELRERATGGVATGGQDAPPMKGEKKSAPGGGTKTRVMSKLEEIERRLQAAAVYACIPNFLRQQRAFLKTYVKADKWAWDFSFRFFAQDLGALKKLELPSEEETGGEDEEEDGNSGKRSQMGTGHDAPPEDGAGGNEGSGGEDSDSAPRPGVWGCGRGKKRRRIK